MLAGGVSVEDVAAMAAHLPRDSATMLAVQPKSDFEAWGITDWLLANVYDLLAAANWQRGGGKGARPKPFTRPKPPKAENASDGLDVDDFKAWYAAQPGGRAA